MTLAATVRMFVQSPFARRALLVALLTINFILVAVTISGFFLAEANYDWVNFYVPAGRQVFSGGLYTSLGDDAAFRYSPVAAYAFALLTPIGPVGWTALHFAVLGLLGRTMAIMTLLSWPFWADVYNGNITVFAFVAAMLAVRGRRSAMWVFMAFSLMAPRPIMIPVLLWLLWRRPESRLPFAVLFILHFAIVGVSGWGPEWLGSFTYAGDDFGKWPDLGPARLIGLAWIPIGALLAAWLTVRDHLGLASLAASPYWLSHYGLMLLLECRRPENRAGRTSKKVAS